MKDEILKILLKYKGEFISGESISEKLEISRAAVWKSVNVLKNQGYVIDSVSNKGYCLIDEADKLDSVLIRSLMHTELIGCDIKCYESLGSTNDEAKNLAENCAADGTAVIAEKQLNGRGRLGRVWNSEKGSGIYVSLILKPCIKPQNSLQITILSAMAVSKALKTVTGLDTGIKWPNDIIAGNKKICGILTEMRCDMDIVQWIIPGIGINVNQEYFNDEIKDKATSVFIETGKKYKRYRIAAEVLNELEYYYKIYIEHGFNNTLLDEYRNKSVNIGKAVSIRNLDRSQTGIVEDISKNGGIIVRFDDGQVKEIISGDVSVRGINGYV